MNFKNTRAVVETGFISALVMVFVFLGSSFPLMGPLATVLMPATLLVLGLRRGVRWSVLSLVTVLFMTAVLISPWAVLVIAVFGCIGILPVVGYERGWSTGKRLIIPAIVGTILIPFIFWLSAWAANMDVIGLLQQTEATFYDQLKTSYEAQGVSSAEIAQVLQYWQAVVTQMKQMLVAGLFASMVAITYLTIWVAGIISRRTGGVAFPVPTISEWRVPIWAVALLCLGIIFPYASQRWAIPYLDVIGRNCYALGIYMTAVQGLACLWVILGSFRIMGTIRWILILLGVLYTPILVGLGVIDLLIDCRRRFARRDNTN